jgi:hypothetical protein
MKALSRLLFAGVSIGGFAAGFTAPAHATLQFTVGIPGTESSFTCVDNDTACDTNPAQGEIDILSMSFDDLLERMSLSTHLAIRTPPPCQAYPILLARS